MATPESIRALDVVVTAGCNLTCSYCFQNDKKAKSIDWEALRSGIDLLMRSRDREVRLGFYGGEPLMEFPTIRRAVEYAEQSRPPEKRVRYVIITNGTFLDDSVADFLAFHDFEVRLSFDGVPAAMRLRGRGTFEQLDGLLDRLRDRHPRFYRRNLSINLTMAIPAMGHLADSIAYFLRKRVREVAISMVETQASLWKRPMIDALDRQFARIHRMCVRHYLRTGETPLQNLVRNAPATEHAPRDRAMCGVGQGEVLALDVDGKVYGCATFAESFQTFRSDFLKSRLETMRLGNPRERGFRKRLAMYPQAVAEARIFDAKQDKHSSYGRCGECRFLETCQVCPMSIGYLPGNTDPDRIPDHLCAFNLISLKYREKFPLTRPTPAEIVTGRARVPLEVRNVDKLVRGLNLPGGVGGVPRRR